MASSSKSERIYHVFLSFRGTDVRNNFLDHLYTALDLKGIYTYVDSEELRKGDQIESALMKAIEESHIAVIVFSEDYASSSWCLEEVAKIMECKEERNLMVFPVFYKVEPREVRTPRAKYREAMVKHESKFGENSDKVKKWKRALFNAGSLSGWHLKDGDDSEHIQRIVKDIATHLGRAPLHVAKHLVGINSRVLKLKSVLNLESNDRVLMVGLWGQGGIGKTTLAKAIYNDIFTQFEGSSFLANVRENSKDCKGLVTLQEQLLSEILLRKQRLVVSSIDAGTNLIQERLFRKKVLIVLDDVDDMRQLSTLAGEGKWFGNGSRIIFTTRDEHLLTAHGIDQDHVYEVKLLDDNEAHELLTKHAFPTNQKLKIRTDLVDGVLNYTKGLPLALEVLGSFLVGRGEHGWKSALKKLSRIPDKSINDVLKISYDGLEENEKEIFLHIACFFKGCDSEYIKKVLDSCNFEIAIGLEILTERSLISIEHEHIQMHDLIQLMGTDIVNQECRDDPGRRSKLWLYDDVLDVLSSDMGDFAVKAIVLKPPELKEICIDANAFTKMRRLRLLIVRNVHNSLQDPICLPNKLRWFEWHGAPWIPEFSSGPKKLVGLDINECSMTVVPKQFKDFQQLKYLNFSKCESLVHIPDLSCTPNLEELDLQNCKNLVEAHNSIAYHDKLQVLNLSGCSELCIFPNVLKSKNLQVLDLDNCTKFERFPEIPHKLEDLKELWLKGTAIKKLPESIENLVALEAMCLNNCKNLVSLPSSIYELHNIDSLALGGCTNLIKFPKYEDSADSHKKSGLSNLSWLDLVGCNLSEVEFLENLSCFPSLTTLFLGGNNITSLPTSINKRQLEQLEVSNCHQLQEIPELPLSLRILWADDCESLRKNGDFTSIHNFFRRTFAMAPDQYRHSTPSFLLPRGEIPDWVLPVEDSSISFMASANLYDKFLGFSLCFVLGNDEQKTSFSLEIEAHINGKTQTHYKKTFDPLDSDRIWLQYHKRDNLWKEVNFGQNDGSYLQFGLTMASRNLKKWGFRIICKPLEEDLKVVLQDNQLIDPVLLYEVGHESIYFGAENPLMHEDDSIEKNLQDSQDCPMSTEKQSQIISESNHKIVLHQGMRSKTMLTSNWTGRDANGGVGLQLLISE